MNDSGNPLEAFPTFDFRSPDYGPIFAERMKRLSRLRKDGGLLSAVKAYYRDDHYVEFVQDWGMTRDPRLASEGLPVVVPFMLFPRQQELLHWFDQMMKSRTRGVVDKTRDCGASWCALAYSCYRFIFFEYNDIGFGSRKEDLIDSKNDPKALFPKARMFIGMLPKEFQPAEWNERRDAPYLKLINPENGSTIIGEGGDNIGRGGRTLIYFVDEHAYVERPQLAEAALSENTNTQINISTHNGTDTTFYKQCLTFPKDRVFEFDWKDDPRKSEEWYEKKRDDPATDPVIFAQEVDRDPSASVADGFIESALIDAPMKAGPADAIASGPYVISVDVASMGNDKSIVNIRRGAINHPQKTFRKLDGANLAAEVERIIDKLLAGSVAPLGAIIYELEGPGYEFHGAIKTGRYAEACRPLHPGRKLKSAEFWNERSRWWGIGKEWLEEGGKSVAPCQTLRRQLTSIRYEWKNDRGGERKLLLEDKKQYKSRLAADSRNKAAGPSPDEADAFMMSFAPVKMSKITKPKPVGILDDIFMDRGAEFTPLDSVVGW